LLNPLTMKLEQFTSFSSDDRRQLDRLASGEQKTWKAKRDIIRDGDHVDRVHLITSGLAARNKIMPDGKRQIMAFMIPGDLCDLEVFVLGKMDHSITALNETTCALIPSATIEKLLTDMGGLTRALWWSTMTDTAVLRERIIDYGQRDGAERLAHLFYELLVRFRMIGMAANNVYPFQVTQDDLADATGMTAVHLNRILQMLRRDGLIEFSGKVVKVQNPTQLKRFARFNADYLHLQRSDASLEITERTSDLV
jgi:CRP-like cAMP-binding protein